MEKGKYRGVHYHVESNARTQVQIMKIIEDWLVKQGATRIDPKVLAIGNVEFQPASASCWEQDGKSTVLWLSGYNGALHVETNKTRTFATGIITKPILIDILKGVKIEASFDANHRGIDCEDCVNVVTMYTIFVDDDKPVRACIKATTAIGGEEPCSTKRTDPHFKSKKHGGD